MDDIKATLHTLLTKSRNLQPKYKFNYELEGKQEFYSCDCSVFGFNYVAHSGWVQSKKEAQTRAATIFAKWLIENKHFSAEQFPQLQSQQMDGQNEKIDVNNTNGNLQEDIKCTLFAVMGKAKIGQPQYKFYIKNDGRQYFECECNVPGIDFVAESGRAQTKKIAQTVAAERYARWLVQNGVISADSFPQLKQAANVEEKD